MFRLQRVVDVIARNSNQVSAASVRHAWSSRTWLVQAPGVQPLRLGEWLRNYDGSVDA